MSSRPSTPRLIWVPLRVLVIAFLSTLMSFAIAVLLGILGSISWGLIHHSHPNLPAIYRHFAPIVAGTIGIIVLVVAGIVEGRRYHRDKVLAAIEQMI
ncbi:MAG TPA: hypothetical protein VLK33_22085 [Terriglobales bacterium]|nr:hypothetical protein [Terriglobales bacterium]